MMSGQAHIEMAVKATRLGALDFLEKPLSTEKLLLTVENVLKLKRLESENKDLRRRVGKQEMVWTGETMRCVIAQVDRVAAGETRVCIYGETGTGKELVARALHEKSARAAGPFVTLNCAAIPAELIESELFGHEKDRLPELLSGTSADLNRHITAHFFWMRLAICLQRCRQNCCVCWKRRKWSESAATSRSAWTCAS